MLTGCQLPGLRESEMKGMMTGQSFEKLDQKGGCKGSSVERACRYKQSLIFMF